MSTEPITHIGIRELLQRVELAGQYQRAARTRQLGLHPADVTALEHLVAFGPLTPGELGHRLGLTSGGVTALTGRLEAAGWVCREQHPTDGRMRVLTATAEGAEHQTAHIRPVLAAADAALDGLSEYDTDVLAHALEALLAAKQLSAKVTPGPPRERAPDCHTRALLM
jgi:DNA-binding MarR family transcriptional regulator